LATKRYNDTRDEIRSYRRSDGSRRQVLLQDVDGQLLSARSYEHGKRRAHQVLWEQQVNGVTIRRVAGRLLEWRDTGWVILDGREFSFAKSGPRVAAFDSLTLSSLTLLPDDLARQRRQPEEMNYSELRAYIDRALANGEDATRNLVDLHLKVAFPLTCFVILLLGAPVAANARGGRANSFGIGVLICFVFYSCVKAGQALGWNGIIDPWLGAWIANLLFGAIGAVMLRRAHT
jgi:lipopolysaccharide export system permease protein